MEPRPRTALTELRKRYGDQKDPCGDALTHSNLLI